MTAIICNNHFVKLVFIFQLYQDKENNGSDSISPRKRDLTDTELKLQVQRDTLMKSVK